MPAPEWRRADRPATWLSPLSVTPEERPALLHATEGSCRSSQSSTPTQVADAPESFADVRLSDAIAYAYPSIDEDDGSPPFTSAHKTATSSGTASAGEGHGQPLAPTYFGYLEVKEDALRLLEGSFQGFLHHSSRGPQGAASTVRSGYIFIWEQEISAIQHWDDGISWTPLDHDDDFWISRETRLGDGLWRKTISIPAKGRLYHFVSYYNPWDTVNGTLKALSEDSDLRRMNLRNELASQLTTSSPSIKHCRLLKDSSSVGRLQFMRSALLFCLCFADEDLYEYLLQRNAGDWFPHVPSNPAYWHELSSRDPCRGMKPRELKTQIKLLLLSLIEFSNGRAPSRLLRYQPSNKFSAAQNRSLCGEIFRIPHYKLLSRKPFDPAKLSTDLARSVLFDQSPKMDPMSVKKWRNGLTILLPIDPPVHGVSADTIGILEQVTIEECEKIRMTSMVYCHQFPRFAQANNSLPLFLVVCQSVPVSSKFAELLHDWARSTDGIKTYHSLLETNQDALPPDELMLSLSALAVFQSIRRGTEPDSKEPPERVQLIDIHRLLTGENTSSSDKAIIREMVWSFFRTVVQVLPPDTYPPYVRFLDPALAAVSPSEQNLHGIVDHYWMKRLRFSLNNADALAEVWKDVQSVPSPVKPLMKYTKSEKQSTIVDGKGEDETSNYSTTSTRDDKIPPVMHTNEEYIAHNPERRTSLPGLGTFLGLWRFGICGGRSG